jgi:hypothetical protein
MRTYVKASIFWYSMLTWDHWELQLWIVTWHDSQEMEFVQRVKATIRSCKGGKTVMSDLVPTTFLESWSGGELDIAPWRYGQLEIALWLQGDLEQNANSIKRLLKGRHKPNINAFCWDFHNDIIHEVWW